MKTDRMVEEHEMNHLVGIHSGFTDALVKAHSDKIVCYVLFFEFPRFPRVFFRFEFWYFLHFKQNIPQTSSAVGVLRVLY